MWNNFKRWPNQKFIIKRYIHKQIKFQNKSGLKQDLTKTQRLKLTILIQKGVVKKVAIEVEGKFNCCSCVKFSPFQECHYAEEGRAAQRALGPTVPPIQAHSQHWVPRRRHPHLPGHRRGNLSSTTDPPVVDTQWTNAWSAVFTKTSFPGGYSTAKLNLGPLKTDTAEQEKKVPWKLVLREPRWRNEWKAKGKRLRGKAHRMKGDTWGKKDVRETKNDIPRWQYTVQTESSGSNGG